MLMYSDLAGLGFWGGGAMPALAQTAADDAAAAEAEALYICMAEHASDPAYFCSDYPGYVAPQAPSEPAASSGTDWFATSVLNPATWNQPAPAEPKVVTRTITKTVSTGVSNQTIAIVGGLVLVGLLLFKRAG
jgi:hypothetical protein